jgi:hypothetical protein
MAGLALYFFCFTLGLMNLTWFIINDEPLPPYKEWLKAILLPTFKQFRTSLYFCYCFSLQYALIVFFTLIFMNIFDNRKYRQN